MNNRIINKLIFAITFSLMLASCNKIIDEKESETNSKTDNMSVSKYSEITKIFYEENDEGYKAAFYHKEDIEIEKVNEFLESYEVGWGYNHYIYSDPDSWDMYVYYPIEENSGLAFDSFKFCVEDSIVILYVESRDLAVGEEMPEYILIRIQAPMRGAWPNSSRLFIDDGEIELYIKGFST